MIAVNRRGYRLRMSTTMRWLRVLILAAAGLMLLSSAMYVDDGVAWRLLSLAGVIAAVLGIRIMFGPVVVVDANHLTVQPNWPVRRRIPWYRIANVEVVPGFWMLLVELNSGERLELPCVEQLEDLYDRIEHHRHALDA